MSEPFIDTRLFITVRPYLEYAIPDTAMTVVSCLLGDHTSEYAHQKIDSLRNTPLYKSERIECPEGMTELLSHCMRVVNYAIEHVKQVEVDWIDYMQRICNGVQHEIRGIKQDMKEIDAVYKRYRVINKTIADREYRLERMKLQRRMDDTLNAYRQSTPPNVERAPSLRKSTYELREAFANAYGTVDTRRLMILRQYFEWELTHLQTDILESFCKKCIDILST